MNDQLQQAENLCEVQRDIIIRENVLKQGTQVYLFGMLAAIPNTNTATIGCIVKDTNERYFDIPDDQLDAFYNVHFKKAFGQ